MPSYLCWGEHVEDLTTLVRQRYEEGVIAFELLPDGGQEWTVVVECSQKHRNVFSGTEPP